MQFGVERSGSIQDFARSNEGDHPSLLRWVLNRLVAVHLVAGLMWVELCKICKNLGHFSEGKCSLLQRTVFVAAS